MSGNRSMMILCYRKLQSFLCLFLYTSLTIFDWRYLLFLEIFKKIDARQHNLTCSCLYFLRKLPTRCCQKCCQRNHTNFFVMLAPEMFSPPINSTIKYHLHQNIRYCLKFWSFQVWLNECGWKRWCTLWGSQCLWSTCFEIQIHAWKRSLFQI